MHVTLGTLPQRWRLDLNPPHTNTKSSYYVYDCTCIHVHCTCMCNLQSSYSNSFTVKGDSAHGTFYVSLCSHNSHCSQGSSVCYTDSYGQTHNVASFTHQTIMTQGLCALQRVCALIRPNTAFPCLNLHVSP